MLTFPNFTNFQGMFAWMNRQKHVEFVCFMSNLTPESQLNEGLRFLGGLSLHLNHLIQSRMEISYQLFGSLPIGLLLSNLDSRQLETSPMTCYDQF